VAGVLWDSGTTQWLDHLTDDCLDSGFKSLRGLISIIAWTTKTLPLYTDR